MLVLVVVVVAAAGVIVDPDIRWLAAELRSTKLGLTIDGAPPLVSNLRNASRIVPLVRMLVVVVLRALMAAACCWRALSSFTNELTSFSRLLLFDMSGGL